MDGIHIRNPQQMHISFQYSSDVRASNLFLKAPGNSPNTDGFNINATRNIHVTKSSVSTGKSKFYFFFIRHFSIIFSLFSIINNELLKGFLNYIVCKLKFKN